MAISIDGYIALEDGNSDWVSKIDGENFLKAINDTKCVVIGSKTYNQYLNDLFPIDDVSNIIVTSKKMSSDNKNVHFASNPRQAVDMAKRLGHSEIVLGGGGTINGSFLESDLIDEIYLTVHPIILGKGIKLYEEFDKVIKLDFVSSKTLEEGLIQLHYKVIK